MMIPHEKAKMQIRSLVTCVCVHVYVCVPCSGSHMRPFYGLDYD